MSTQAWFEHFKHKLQGLTEVFEKSGTPLSLLHYALKEKHLTSEEYLQWAMAHYKLPQLQARFFSETPPSKEMFAKWATHYPWSAECLPVAEWDGALIVACLQPPPQGFPSQPPGIMVLAPIECLEKTWNAWSPAPLESMESPVGINLSMSTPSQSDPTDLFALEDVGEVDTSEQNSDEENPLLADTEIAALEGIFDDVSVARLEKTLIQPSPFAAAESASEMPVLEVPESEPLVISNSILKAPVSTTPVAAAPVAEATVVENRLTAKKPVLDKPEAEDFSEERTVIQPKDRIASAETSTPPPPPMGNPKPEAFEDQFINKTIPITPRSAGVAKPTMNPVASGNFSLEKLKKKNSALIADKVKKILSEMKSQFEKSMILTLDEQETQVTAFAWDENFLNIKDTSLRVPLKTPSIFNIVASTQKPFHGYISLNSINEKFFEDWNNGKIPDHVTVSPIMMNDKLVGMLVGFAEKSAYNKVSLGLAERLSNDFTKGFAA